MSPPLLLNRGAAERRLPAPAARPPAIRRGRAAPRPPAPLPTPAARPPAHSPAPGELSHRRLLPSLPPSCQVEPGLPPPDPSLLRDREPPPPPQPAGPLPQRRLAPPRSHLGPAAARRRGMSEGGEKAEAAVGSPRPRRNRAAPPRGPCVGRGGRLLPAGTPREAKWGGGGGELGRAGREAGTAWRGVRRARRARLPSVPQGNMERPGRRGRKARRPRECPPTPCRSVGRWWRGASALWGGGNPLLPPGCGAAEPGCRRRERPQVRARWPERLPSAAAGARRRCRGCVTRSQRCSR